MTYLANISLKVGQLENTTKRHSFKWRWFESSTLDVFVSELRRGEFTDFVELLDISQTNAHEIKLQCFEVDLVDNLNEVQISSRQV